MDRVLQLFETQPGYRHFVTDGQTIMLEDYLEIRPEKEAAIRQHVQIGRLSIGPWYILPDEYIVSGESLVRNLLAGQQVAKRFGPISKAGYVPDPFGHIAQLPQILNGFGVDNFIFLRGMPAAEKYGTEFMWAAPDDKSEVLAIWMKNIYFNASLLGYEAGWGDSENMKGQFKIESAIKQLQGQVDDLGKWTRRDTILLNNGCDHTFPQFEIPDIVTTANKQIDGVEFVHSTYDAFIADVKRSRRNLARMSGELRSSRYIVILPGVLSTRMYLKQLNRRCENLLERWAEPFAALSRHLDGEDYRANLMYAWKLLLQNHPHDSICGCSTDAVHREMVTRFERVQQVGESVVNAILRDVHRRINTQRESALKALVVWNPIPGKRRGPLEAKLTLPEADGTDFVIVDSNGKVVLSQTWFAYPHRLETVFLEFNRKVRDVHISLDASMKGIGYQTFWLVRKKDSDARAGKLPVTNSVETKHYRVTINTNGTFDVYDRARRSWFRRLNLFEDTEDVGDEYDYSHALKSRTLTTEKCRAKITFVDDGPVYTEIHINIPWAIPSHATENRKGRVRRNVNCTIDTRVKVFKNHPRIEVVTEFHNNAEDHRVRVHFPAPADARFSYADGHFSHIRRPFTVKTTKKHDSPEPTTHHMRHFVALSDTKAGLAILNRELTEYEILDAPKGRKTIAVTLLRSVRWLSQNDLLTRKSYCGPQIETPDAQCPGSYRTEYAILPFKAGRFEEIISEAESYAAPVLMRQEDLHSGDMPSSQVFVDTEQDEIVWSTWKPAENDEGSVIRFYNPTSHPLEVCLNLNPLLRLDGACDMKEDKLHLPRTSVDQLGKHEIRSYRISSRTKRPKT